MPLRLTTLASLDLQGAVYRVVKTVRDAEAMRQAAQRMDRMREARPETNVAIELIRDSRNEA
jgi:hypothetical protein